MGNSQSSIADSVKSDIEGFKDDTAFTKNPQTAARHDSIISTIGATPLVRLNKLAPNGVEIYVKCEAFNPMGSVKDRLALGMIEYAEVHGLLKPGQTVIEATSGNTGLGLAMVCAAKGYPFVCVMSEIFSIERRKMMRFLGAKVVLTNPSHKFGGMLQTLITLRDQNDWYWPNQFENEANAWIHRRTTGPEIVQAMAGKRLDWFVCAYGTGGTVKGVGQVLRAARPEAKVMVCEPSNAPLLLSGIKTAYTDDGSITKESHPVFRPHLLQGWTPDFVPRMLEAATSQSLYDEVGHVNGTEAVETSRRLATSEGIFTGTSGGGVLSCALKKAASLPPGSVMVVMLPDTGERYLSTPLFDGVPADMTEEEKALSASAPKTSAFPQPLPPPDDQCRGLVKEFVASSGIAIVSMESCEFCWTIKKLLTAVGVDYALLDFDALQYAPGNQGNIIRSSVQELTECVTFPQVFIAGKFFGGAADACISWRKGELQGLIEKAGAKPPTKEGGEEWNGYNGDAFEFLPKWMLQNPMRAK